MSALSFITPLVAAVPLLVVPTACNDSDSGSEATKANDVSSPATTVDADFVARADAVCEPYAEYTSKAYFRLAHFNRYAPDAALLPKVAAYLAQNPAYRRLVPDLEALGDPESGSDAWATVLGDFRATADDINKEIADARDADAQHFSGLTDQFESDMTTLYSDLQTAGLGGTSCSQAEGDPLKPPPAGG
jgi:hypothetical protein